MSETSMPVRRVAAAVGMTLVTILVAATIIGLPATATATSGAAGTADTTSFGVVTFNLKAPRTATAAGAARLKSDVLKLAGTTTVDIIGFQESLGSLAMLRAVLPEVGWAVYAPRGVEDPIAWRTSRFTLATDQAVPTSVWQVSEANRTIARHFPDRYLTRVLLRDQVSGRTVDVFDTHVNQFIEKYGIPRRNPNWRQAKLHLARMANYVSQSRADVTVVTGDFNIDARDDARKRRVTLPYTRYAPLMLSNYRLLGLPSAYTGRQNGPRRPSWIDYVYLKNGNRVGARMTSQAVLRAYRWGSHPSDHAPVLVRFSVTIEPTAADPTQ
jgi:endonuclease/exonuclease/phosphatase family metal-dependent hydrolase